MTEPECQTCDCPHGLMRDHVFGCGCLLCDCGRFTGALDYGEELLRAVVSPDLSPGEFRELIGQRQPDLSRLNVVEVPVGLITPRDHDGVTVRHTRRLAKGR